MSTNIYRECVYKDHKGDNLLLVTEFYKDASRKDGYDKQCKVCRNEIKRRRIESNPEEERRKTRERQKRKYHNNPEYRQAQKKLIYKQMPKITAKRRACKLQATPTWFEEKKVAALYEERLRLTQETNVMYHVDHIVPLINNDVCGLHCIDNLQLLTQEENMSKGNKFES